MIYSGAFIYSNSIDPLRTISHVLLDRPGRVIIKYVDSSVDPSVTKIESFDALEASLIDSHIFNNTLFGRQNYSDMSPLTGVLFYHRDSHERSSNQDYYHPDLIQERDHASTFQLHINGFPQPSARQRYTYIESDEYPVYAMWPDNETQEPLEPTIYNYIDFESIATTLEHTQDDIRLNLVRHFVRDWMEEISNTILFSLDEAHAEAAKIYFAYLYNTLLYLHNSDNLFNRHIWEEFRNILTIDAFMNTFDVGRSDSNPNQVLRSNMYDHRRVYGYRDGEFYIRRSSVSGENPATIPDNTPALGDAVNHHKVRQMMNMHPIQAHSNTKLALLTLRDPHRTYLTSADFNADTLAYNITVPTGATLITTVLKGYALQTVELDSGVITRDSDERLVFPNTGNYPLVWTVTSLNQEHTRAYTVNVTVVQP